MKKFSSTEVLAMATEHPWNDQAWDLNLTENITDPDQWSWLQDFDPDPHVTRLTSDPTYTRRPEIETHLGVKISVKGYYSRRPYAHNPYGLNGGLLFYNFTRLAMDNFATPFDENPIVS